MAKRWKKEELTYLKRYASTRRVSELADRFNTNSETIRGKLLELGISAIDSVPEHRIADDPLIGAYSQGLESLQKKQWSAAVKTFRKVLEETDQPELAERSRRYLAMAESKAAGDDDAFAKEDPYLVAVYHRNRGELDDALEICTRGQRASKDDRFALLAAGIYALRGDLDLAAEHLSRAVESDPRNRSYARHDTDFAEMRVDPEYADLF